MKQVVFTIVVCLGLAALMQWGQYILNFIFRIYSSERGSSIGGKFAKVMYGSSVVAGMGTFSFSGFTPDIQEDTAFGDTVKSYVNAGIADAGTISFSGNYDPSDANGQDVLNTLCESGLGTDQLYFYISTSCFYRVAAGGEIILTKGGNLTMSKNGLGTISYEGRVSAKALERVGTYSAA